MDHEVVQKAGMRKQEEKYKENKPSVGTTGNRAQFCKDPAMHTESLSDRPPGRWEASARFVPLPPNTGPGSPRCTYSNERLLIE